MPNDDVTVTDNPSASRFEARVDGLLAVAEYRRQGNRIAFTHTEVPDAIEGRGVGSALARAALDRARAEGWEVVPLCPFIADFIKRNPEYSELTADARQAPEARGAGDAT
jgi:predicted GNAT family acetyltransferase